ncbi:DEAD/DEAH box helicase [Candidatus Bipolaricaulota bacterium]|nr:DEAD/DEAH box helicase [Candidatus Bipolaricaulota bacterium]
MEISKIVESLKKQNWYEGQIEHTELLPERKAEYGKANYDGRINDFLERRGIDLFSHQSQAINHIAEGKNVIITTPTASGKTLAFNIPVFDRMLKDPDSRALYIYPTKALSQDQLETIKEMEQELQLDLNPGVYDGDTPRSARPGIRRDSRIILTNPYGLHHYLEWHHKWRDFFSKLEYVVMDEVHSYRGVFGSNVAMLVRRMKRIFGHYDSDPQFVLSSATIANPLDHAKKLVGEDFSLVSDDSSFRGRKSFLFWNPLTNPDNSPHNQTSKLMAYFVNSGLQTLCFTLSRRLAELIAEWSSNRTEAPVKSYRAGYRPEERRELERELRTGEIRGISATNALELGVDIGGLDAVIISGYPGTITSSWQQAGRAGRGREDSLVVLVGFENPLDQFFLKHPREFFDRDHERAILDLSNPNITMGHLTCAATELPIREDEYLGQKYSEELKVLLENELLQDTPNGAVFAETYRPSESVRLDNIDETTIKILHNGKLLETMDKAQAYREAHENATLLHQGKTYIVKEFDLEQGVAEVKWKEVDYFTQAISESSLEINDRFSKEEVEDVGVWFGNVSVSEVYSHYKEKKYDRVLDVHPLDLPPLEFDTECSWFRVPEQILVQVEEKGLGPRGGLHAIEHAVISLTPFYAMCDRWDIGGFSSRNPLEEGGTIFIYDAYEGGIGIAEEVYDLLSELLERTYELIVGCDCEEGCPSCIYSPKCGNDNDPLDKEAAIYILEKLGERFGY